MGGDRRPRGQGMRIGELAERARVTPRTIRYYESLGLLRPSGREPSGYRSYTEAELARLEKIDALKQLGLSLDEIQGVIDLYFTDPSGIQGKRKVIELLEGHLRETEEKIAALEGFRADLRRNIARMRQLIEAANRPGG